ncbi:sulfolactaldehyde 3-reductase, partial [Salmonella enterica]
LARAAGRGGEDWSAILEQVRISAGLTANVKK